MAGEPRSIYRIWWWATIALAAMPVLGMRPMVLVILMWSALGFASLISGTRAPTWNWKEMLLLGSPFLLMLLDSARASQWSAAWKLAETSSVLLLFPIGFTMIDRSRAPTLRDRMIDLFSWSALTLAIWANGGILIRSEAWPSAVDASVAFSYFYRTAFAMVTGVHAPFAAYWFFCAALFQMHHVLQDKHTPPWRSLLAGALTIAGILIGSRMPIIAFGVAFASLLFFRFETRKALGWIFGTVVTLSILVIALPGSRDRAMEVFSTLYSRTGANGINSVSVRSPILQCSLELLEEHWILGAGQPAVQSALDECYSDQQHSFMADGSYSTHNQLLHWWLSFGVLGVTAFVLLFGHSLAEAFRRRDAIHFAFVLFILLCCFTENVLARQWGVVLFACFNTLFLVPIPKQDEGSEG